MGQPREFEARDIPEVVALWQKMFRAKQAPDLEAVAKYFHGVFFRNPWQDDELPSWVFENQGRIVGFLGVLPRRMFFHQESIRTAVITQLMVEPHGGAGIAALEMMRRYFNGPQDLSWTDGANDSAQKLWVRLGGEVSYLYSQEWRRVLRPARFAATLLERKAAWRRLVRLAQPACGLVDAVAMRLPIGPFRRMPVSLRAEEATSGSLLSCYHACLGRRALQPEYTADNLDWQLEMLRATTGHGALRKQVVYDAQGSSLGWYLYYVRPGAEAKVLQVGGKDNTVGQVFDHLFADARAQGAVAVSGQMEPRYQRELSDHHCRFRCLSLGVLLHARDKDLLYAIQRGDAALTRMEGEWWLRLGSDSFEQSPPTPVVAQSPAQPCGDSGHRPLPAELEAAVLRVAQAPK